MNDDEFSDENERPARPPKPSKTPSWVMLGFVFGALFVWALPRHEPTVPAITAPTPTPVSASGRESTAVPRLREIENVFAEWGHRAVWHNDLTEVALWNSEKKSFSEFYEVLRVGESYYFRTISRLTRPLLTHGVDPASPLQFTETQAQRDEWLRERSENAYRAISEAARQNLPEFPTKPDTGKK